MLCIDQMSSSFLMMYWETIAQFVFIFYPHYLSFCERLVI